MICALAEAHDAAAFGGKAVQLGTGLRAGLPVPAGFAVSADQVDAVVRADVDAVAALHTACADGGLRAVRSSAVGEDSAAASFAGAHLTVLGVCGAAAVVDAVRRVHASGLAAGARAYRQRLGLAERARMAVVVQELVDADVAGVLFTRNPVSGAAERVIEASWGLGEAVVAGLVIPDVYRLDTDGGLLERRIGEKDLAVRRHPDTGTEEVPVAAPRAGRPCLGPAELAALHGLASACDSVYGPEGHDIEFAFRDGAVFLLQRRPITGG
jgi:pyruvate, water dikinase